MVVLGTQVVRLEKPPVSPRGGIGGIKVRLYKALARKPACFGEQRKPYFRIAVEPVFRGAWHAVDSLLGDNASMFEALLQQSVRVWQAAPLGTLLPKRALLPALGANGRSMGSTASLGSFSGGRVDRSLLSSSSILVGIAAFVVAMALIGLMPIFGKLVL